MWGYTAELRTGRLLLKLGYTHQILFIPPEGINIVVPKATQIEISGADRALVGEVAELPETQLDAFLALTSSGPAFIALVAEAMADGAVAAGLPRALAQHLAHHTLAGTAALLHEQELHPGMLKDMVSSPGGTTIAGLRHLERQGLRSALIEAVVAAAERSRQLA